MSDSNWGIITELERMVDLAENRLVRINTLKSIIEELLVVEEEGFRSSRREEAFEAATRALDGRHE